MIIRMQACGSTNSELAKMHDADAGTVVVADCQMAGRGQRGNSWESAAGKNLTFSKLLRPYTISAAHQFELSMIVSLGICKALTPVLGEAYRPLIKWPNDIYVGDSKICGILIENSLVGTTIERSIVGVGINVNQTEFLSDAPNPISIRQLTDRDTNLDALLDEVVSSITDILDQYENDPEPDELHALYMSMLWRNDGVMHQWQTSDGQRFEASIVDVALDGTLTLRRADGVTSSFLFKEVSAVIAQ